MKYKNGGNNSRGKNKPGKRRKTPSKKMKRHTEIRETRGCEEWKRREASNRKTIVNKKTN